MVILDHDTRVASRSNRATRTGAPTFARGVASRLANTIAFCAALGLVLLYALRGGSYDLVAFEEYGLVIWVVLAAGIAFGLLPRTRPSLPVLILLGALLGYVGWTALSLTWTESSELTTVEIARSLDYLGLVALIASTVGQGTWRPATAGLGVGAMIVCLLAVASRLFPAAFPDDALSAAAHFERLSYPFGYWNAVGAWGAMSTAGALAWSAHAERRLQRALALACVPIACLMTYLSYSRAGVAGTALAALAVLALSRNRFTALVNGLIAAAGAAIAIEVARATPPIADATGTHGAVGVLAALAGACALCAVGAFATSVARVDRWSVPRSVLRPAAGALVMVVLLAGAVLGPKLATRAWHSFKSPNVVNQSTDPTQRLLNLSGSRYLIWKSATQAFTHKPLTGTGAGTFEFWWNRHTTDPEFLRDAHSIWFQNAAELGIAGLLLIVAVMVSALATGIAVRRRARRRASAGAATAGLAVFVVYLVHASVDWMWESTAVTVLALAVVAASSARLSRRSLSLGWRLRIVLAIFAAIAAAMQVPGLLSTAEIRRSQQAERSGNASVALAWANEAVSVEPWAASPYEQRGMVLEASGSYAQAAADLHRAIDREPTNFTHWLILARIDTERGQLAAAVSDYRQADRLRPLAQVFAPAA